MIPEQHRKKVAWVAVCCALLGGVEGLRTTPYFDVGGVPTACFGETRGIHMDDHFTKAQCTDMLGTRVEDDFGPGVDRCVRHSLPDARKAAYVSVAYNVGVPTFCRSSIARKENQGDAKGACDAIMAYNKVRIAGVLVYSPGLNNRREQERALCLKGLQ